MSAPEVSVIVPAYNATATLGDQLAALLAQPADHEIEVLVCDNGSTDDTARLVRRWAEHDERVRLVDASARRGPAAARNIGAAAARGRVLLFCDADDIVGDGWLGRMASALFDDVEVAAGTLEGRSLNSANRYSVSWEVSGDIRLGFWPRFRATASSNLGVRKDVFDEADGFDELLLTCEDLDFCWRVQLAGHPLVFLTDAVVHSRQRDGLRAVFRQARSYAAGTRALRHKYSAIAAADADPPAAPAPALCEDGAAVKDAGDAASGPSRLLARAGRVFTRTGQANVAWRLGEALGQRFGRIDPRIRPLPVSLLERHLAGGRQ
ncbi:glycosyltransferase [Microbacterium immunditiarum]|uniref:Glycosyltransferase involved in cell wall biosynthesis n=1 Tax=Microbacterium immunditiarum TaxID=337480 RepID=A0A7Y9KIK9_9MICO|nr:glycosyltransferase involved in cell wall biosynthesis [Microbacterium immunditiarum]